MSPIRYSPTTSNATPKAAKNITPETINSNSSKCVLCNECLLN